MKYLHTMVRVTDIDASLRFYRDALGLKELSRKDYPQGRFTLVFLAAPVDESAQDVRIARPPRGGVLSFGRFPDNISVELLQRGGALAPAEPWKSMPNTGQW